MKHHQLFIVLAIACSVAACGPSKSGSSKNPKPEEVTNSFLKSFMELDIETCKSLCDSETVPLIEMMGAMTATLGEEELKKAKEEAKKTKLDPKKTTCKLVDANNASCTTCCDDNGAMNEKPILLKKVDGKWKIHMTKEDLGGEEAGQ